jgi:hypothetical protein
MTVRTNARIAGFAFLFYIVVGVSTMIIARGIPGSEDTAERLAVLAEHAPLVRTNMLLGILTGFTALVLGAALYGYTRGEDPDIAALALACRVVEGASVLVPTIATLALLSIAADAPNDTGIAIAGLLWKLKGWNVTLAATFFAVGSTLFSWLLLRGALAPMYLARLGVFASVMLVIGLPLQLARVFGQPWTWIIWIPIAVFEVVLAVWLLWRGGKAPRAT